MREKEKTETEERESTVKGVSVREKNGKLSVLRVRKKRKSKTKKEKWSPGDTNLGRRNHIPSSLRTF